jgi:enoyl-CoA hydratase
MSRLPRGFEYEVHGEVGLLRINAGKANAMSPEFVAGLIDAMAEVRARAPEALVITGTGKVLSAGLALPTLVDLNRDDMRTFMQGFGQAMESVLTFPTPTIAAVNGHAIAGGCVLALMCDYRVMVEDGARIGLNEVSLGIGLPASVLEPLRVRLPARSWAPIALAGELFSPEDALALELVDDLVGADGLESSALERASALGGAPLASAQVKAALLRPLIAEIRAHEDAELEAWLDTWVSPDGRRLVGEAIAHLRS